MKAFEKEIASLISQGKSPAYVRQYYIANGFEGEIVDEAEKLATILKHKDRIEKATNTKIVL